ncbi:MAG: aminotransferase class I/II-fold pyridoxal phosphate-dependent enzyme [Clostridia bacterium]|nr:aminotransferase class I/II-fold pyridoxal phosphate-dependent enzyme [Clostridia bacterium]
MYEYHILTQLKKYTKANKSFHVPGHKARGDFNAKFPVAKMDVTELSYSDNLACPDGVILKAQRDVAEILGAKKSWFLTDGSTCGVLSMLYVLRKRGNKIIVPRNCHQSVWNACRLFGFEPVIVQGKTKQGVLLPPEPKLIDGLLDNDINICGMIAVSPDYYGNVAPLKEYSEIIKKHKRLLAVDEAHGAHLAFERENGAYAGVYADIWVDGAHKCLPSLTQGAVLSVNDERLSADIEDALSIFRTTSPSYPIMASVEYGIKYVANNKTLLTDAKSARKIIEEKLSGFEIYPSDDWTKVAVDFAPLKISPDKAAKELENKGIYAELSDGRHLLFYLSPMTTAKDANELSAALISLKNNKKIQGTYKALPELPENERTYSFQYALNKKAEQVPLKSAVGRMCAKNAGITPPCIPVAVAGEMITAQTVKVLESAKNTFGLCDGKITVVKK